MMRGEDEIGQNIGDISIEATEIHVVAGHRLENHRHNPGGDKNDATQRCESGHQQLSAARYLAIANPCIEGVKDDEVSDVEQVVPARESAQRIKDDRADQPHQTSALKCEPITDDKEGNK